MQTISKPTIQWPSLSSARVQSQSDMRLTGKLGFPGPIYISHSAEGALAWDDAGNALMAVGAPAAMIASMTPGSSGFGVIEVAIPAAPLEIPVIPAPAPESLITTAPAVLPEQSDDPASFLSKLTDVIALKTWVLSEGLIGPHAEKWARIATACDWQIPPPVTEGDAQKEATADGVA